MKHKLNTKKKMKDKCGELWSTCYIWWYSLHSKLQFASSNNFNFRFITL